MAFEIIDNIDVPASTTVRARPRGEFAQTVDSLKVGQGFIFESDKGLKAHYPKVSPSKFPSDVEGMNKKFKLWIAGEGKVGVKRLNDVAESEGDGEHADTNAAGGSDTGDAE